ncbi:MAG: hypothetical protein M1831_003670 [Alyxoria varia]|nr:MAG: hypothetical protein M1831_003670 [Alyxoria varia]
MRFQSHNAHQGVEILSNYGLTKEGASDTEASRDALRCLANLMLLKPQTRQDFVDLGHAKDVASNLSKSAEFDDDFLYCRILFYIIQDTSFDFQPLLNQYDLAGSIHKAVRRSSDSGDGASRKSIAEMALSESLKLLFSISRYYESECHRFLPSVPSITDRLMMQPLSTKSPVGSPTNDLINSLINLDLQSLDDPQCVFPEEDSTRLLSRLVEIMKLSVEAYPATSLDASVAPTVILIRKIYLCAPENVKSFLRECLLPKDDERTKPLGQADTLPGKLLRLSTSGHTPNLRELIPELLFELSGKDPETFVRNVGYGYASGFLANNNIQAPEHRSSKDADDVNFVTGQYLDNEPKSEESPMTEEEKMREAERLFVLFERLKKTGVVNVKNPVEEAIESGRFEELD